MNRRGIEFGLKTVVTIVILMATIVILLYFFTDTFGGTGTTISEIGRGAYSNVEEASDLVSPDKAGGIGDWADPFE